MYLYLRYISKVPSPTLLLDLPVSLRPPWPTWRSGSSPPRALPAGRTTQTPASGSPPTAPPPSPRPPVGRRSLARAPGWQFNTKLFGLKNSFRFHFYSVTCLNYPFENFLLVYGISSQNLSGFSSYNSSQKSFYRTASQLLVVLLLGLGDCGPLVADGLLGDGAWA